MEIANILEMNEVFWPKETEKAPTSWSWKSLTASGFFFDHSQREIIIKYNYVR